MPIQFNAAYHAYHIGSTDSIDVLGDQRVTSRQIFDAIEEVVASAKGVEELFPNNVELWPDEADAYAADAAASRLDAINKKIEETLEKFLGKSDVDLFGCNGDGDMPLHRAVKTGIPQIVRALLSISHGRETELCQARNDGGATALMLAFEHGFLEAGDMLLELGSPVDASAEAMLASSLHDAVRGGHLHVVKASIAIQYNQWLESQLDGAIGKIHSGRKLSDKGLHAFSPKQLERKLNAFVGGETVLISAARGGNVDIVKSLLQAGVPIDLDQVNNWGCTALMFAARLGHVGIVNALLQAGAKFEMLDSLKFNALQWAAYDGRLDVVNTLLQAGAKFESLNGYGRTALMEAAVRGHSEVVGALLQAGAKFDLRDNMGRSALMLAAMNGSLALVNTLVRAGASIDLLDNKGGSALMRAIEGGHWSVCAPLLKAGASTELLDSKDRAELMERLRRAGGA